MKLATLQPAFNAAGPPQLIQEVLHEQPPRPSKIDPRIPRDLETIILKAIAKEPQQRYARAADLAADLQRFLDDRPIQARPIGNLEVMLKWVKRRPAVAALLGLVLLVTLAGLGAFGWQYAEALKERNNAWQQADLKVVEAGLKDAALQKAKQHAEAALEKEKTAREKEQIALRSLDSLKRTLFTAQLVRAGSLAASDPEGALELLKDPETCPPAMRDFSWAFYYGQASRSRWALPTQAGSVDQFAVSADGKTLATHYDVGAVTVWDLDSGKVRVTLPGSWADKTFLLLSPNGKVLYTCVGNSLGGGNHNGLERWETATGRISGTGTALGTVRDSARAQSRWPLAGGGWKTTPSLGGEPGRLPGTGHLPAAAAWHHSQIDSGHLARRANRCPVYRETAVKCRQCWERGCALGRYGQERASQTSRLWPSHWTRVQRRRQSVIHGQRGRRDAVGCGHGGTPRIAGARCWASRNPRAEWRQQNPGWRWSQ